MSKAPQKKAVHFILQGKGGVGKSLVSSILAQFLLSTNNDVKCIDNDPLNRTFSSISALKAQYLPVLNDSKINERNFDQLIDRLISEDGVFIVDNGASTFVPLSSYIIENDVFSVLRERGVDVFVHTVIVGSQSQLETLEGFRALAAQNEIKKIVVWINEFLGDVLTPDGKPFTEMKIYTNNKDKVHGIIRIPRRNQDTFGKDIEVMATKKLTFNEVLESPDFSLMARQRIKTVQRDLYDQLSKIDF